ncbi:MAG TPA: hypothetical protein VLE73_03235 [Candidatus Saccharimonadales bacterium]|nr:hypothetical protein [Candidatus Saccharimonadales bacterium]
MFLYFNVLHNNVRSRFKRAYKWITRYGLAELAGTITALIGFWSIHAATGSLTSAAIAGTAGENIGYYGVMVCREVLAYWRAHHMHVRVTRLWLTAVRSARSLGIEFGPAELIDSLAVRPSLFYIFPLIMPNHVVAAVLIAKLLGDAVFYTIAIVGYKVHKKLFPAKDRI